MLTWAELEAAAPDIALRGRELLDRFQFVLVGTLTKDGSPLILFGGNDPSSGLHSLQGLATIPEAAWELFLGVYCTVWGFRRDAPILSESPTDRTAERPASKSRIKETAAVAD